MMESQDNYGHSLWVVIEKSGGELIGDCGFLRMPEPDEHEIELGYRLMKSWWGRGYATEAAAACVEYGFDRLSLDCIVAVTNPENRASQRVLQKIGFVKYKICKYKQFDVVKFIVKRHSV